MKKVDKKPACPAPAPPWRSDDGKCPASSTGHEIKVWDLAGWQEQVRLPQTRVADLHPCSRCGLGVSRVPR